ncbi:unannotated protein [freshwater metagenome]|uniref:Unannotated protein n=1 Tax=freshwater metagenome TaxID=449393 RepID=A0A6J6U875_9ZZZZ
MRPIPTRVRELQSADHFELLRAAHAKLLRRWHPRLHAKFDCDGVHLRESEQFHRSLLNQMMRLAQLICALHQDLHLLKLLQLQHRISQRPHQVCLFHVDQVNHQDQVLLLCHLVPTLLNLHQRELLLRAEQIIQMFELAALLLILQFQSQQLLHRRAKSTLGLGLITSLGCAVHWHIVNQSDAIYPTGDDCTLI